MAIGLELMLAGGGAHREMGRMLAGGRAALIRFSTPTAGGDVL